jgi:hypothetical protein
MSCRVRELVVEVDPQNERQHELMIPSARAERLALNLNIATR